MSVALSVLEGLGHEFFCQEFPEEGGRFEVWEALPQIDTPMLVGELGELSIHLRFLIGDESISNHFNLLHFIITKYVIK